MRYILRKIQLSFEQHPWVTSLNIIGLSVGISIAMLIFFWTMHETSYDKHFEGSNRIYRVLKADKSERLSAFTSTALAASVQQKYPGIERATCVAPLAKIGKSSTVSYGQAQFSCRLYFIDEHFFELFSYQSLYHASVEMNKPNAVVISAAFARKIFGDKNPVGQALRHVSYVSYDLIVSDVIEVPDNAHLQFDMVVSKNIDHNTMRYWGQWDVLKGVTYVSLAPDVTLSEAQKHALKYFLKERHDDALLYFQPLTDVHLFSQFIDPTNHKKGDYTYVRILSLFCVLLIVAAAINYVIMTNAMSEKRNKEMALKKLYGANRYRILGAVVLESVVFILLAHFIALLLFLLVGTLAVPHYITYFVDSLYHVQYPVFIFLSTLLVAVVSALYTLYFTNIGSVVSMLKGGVSSKGKRFRLFNYLYPLQLTVACVFIVFALYAHKQLNYVLNKDTGIDIADVVAIDTEGFIYQLPSIKKMLLDNPDIYGVTSLSENPVNISYKPISVRNWEGKKEGEEVSISVLHADPDMLDVFHMPLVAGAAMPADMNVKAHFDGVYHGQTPILINETACRALALENPVGSVLDLGYAAWSGYVVGVVPDFNFKPLSEALGPMAIVYDPENFLELMVRFNPNKQVEVLAYIQSVIQQYQSEDYVFNYQFVEDVKSELYSQEIEMKYFVFLFAVIAVFIAVLGLISSVLLDVARKRKSIAVKRVLGASASNIMLQYVWRSATRIALSFIVAVLLAYHFAETWLSAFAYRIITPYGLLVLLGVLVVLVLSLFSLPMVWGEARKNPAVNIKYE